MPNNIAVSITADVADLQVKRAIMSAELNTARKDLRDFAKEAQTTGMTDELRTSMLASGDAVAKLDNQVKSVNRQIKGLTEVEVEETGAVVVNTGAHVSNRAAREALVLVHEALSGNYHRMVGSLMIEAQALGGAEGASKLLTAAMTPLGIAVIAASAALIAAAVAGVQYSNQQEHLTATTLGLGAASGLTASQLEAAASQASSWSDQSSRSSLESAEAFAGAGVRSQQSIAVLSASVQTYAALTGEKAADAQKALATAMEDPIKGAEELNRQLGILDGTQMNAIRTAAEQGDKEQAVAIITQGLQQRIREANDAGIGLNGTWGDMTADLSNLWGWLGRVSDRMETVAGAAARLADGNMLAHAALSSIGADPKEKTVDPNAAKRAQQQARWNEESVAGAKIADGTPEARDAAARDKLTGSLAQLQTALTADTHLHGANSASVKADTAAIAEYKRAIDTYLPSAEKAHRLAELDAQISDARRKHDKDRVADLTKQKELVSTSGQVMSSAEANQRASDASDKGEASVGSGSKGPSAVSQWEQQLHQQEVASGEFFKDQTSSELAFWQSKLSLTKSGSKDWLEVQAKIYDAEKALARSGYQDHLASLNERLEADRNSWTREQADWTEKLAFIKGKFGEESEEYKNAYREMERAQVQHDDEMMRQTTRSIEEQIGERKKAIDAQQKVRETSAASAGSVAKADASTSINPLAEAAAAVRVGQIDAQLSQQKMADLEQFHAYETALLDQAIGAAQAKYGQETAHYQDLLNQKKKADAEYANSKAEIEAQSQAKSIQNILAVRQAYTSYTNSIVSVGVSSLDQLISKQKSWQQIGVGIYQKLVGAAEQQFEKIATKWIVQHVLMTSAQRAQLAIQQGQQVASTATSTAASVASSKTQALALVGLAGAGGVASMAAAPFPLDLGAPAFGAQMAAAAGSLASFAVGTNFLPADMIAQVHAGERIVPKADNDELINLTRRGAGVGGAEGGDAHFHYNPTVNGQMPFADQLAAHEDNLVSMFQNLQRNGRLR